MSDTSSTEAKEMTEEEFRQRQDEQAALQNLKPGSVPDQRPNAIQEFPDSQRSDYDLDREANPPAEATPMDRDAYDRAASSSQAKKADKDSRTPRLLEGEAIRVVDADNDLFNGRTGAIIGVNFTPQGAADARSGDPVLHNFAEVESYTVRLRDEGDHRLTLDREQIEPINHSEMHRTTA